MCHTTQSKKYSKQVRSKSSMVTKRQNVIEKFSGDLANPAPSWQDNRHANRQIFEARQATGVPVHP